MQLCLNMNIFILQTDVKKGQTKCWLATQSKKLPRVILCPFRLAVSQRLGCESPEILAVSRCVQYLHPACVCCVCGFGPTEKVGTGLNCFGLEQGLVCGPEK